VLWKQGQYIPLDPWPGAAVSNSVARGINNNGVVVGESYLPAGQVHAVSWTVVPAGGGNAPPVAAWTVSCKPAPAHSCTFDGTGSRDPDGSIASYKWTNAGGATLSTLATFSRTFRSSRTLTWTLTVTDNSGKQGKLTKTFTVP
jgi:PKD repeat protein